MSQTHTQELDYTAMRNPLYASKVPTPRLEGVMTFKVRQTRVIPYQIHFTPDQRHVRRVSKDTSHSFGCPGLSSFDRIKPCTDGTYGI